MSSARIRQLSETLINQIAAGEVVERPMSIVKELVENSLDAEATRIEVEIEDGGIRRLLVRDNGRGIPADQMSLALQRHCTSKLQSIDQLGRLVSLGFRGEALAAIAAVSDLTLSSRTAEDPHAWQLAPDGRGGAGTVAPTAHPQGTSIEVRDLFARLPARRRFLRQPQTEWLHVLQLLRRMAFCAPLVSFSVFNEGQRALTVPAAVDEVSAARRLRALFGSEFAAAARDVDTANERLRVFGYVAGPELARSQHDLQMLAVNGRVIRDRQLAHAIRLAYEDALPEGRHPCYALQLEIRPEDVDVNVHPGKLEVRFRDLREVHDLVHSAVRTALRTAPETPSLVSYRPPAFAAQPTLGLGSVQARETSHPTSPRRDAPDPETEWLTLLAERYAVLREGQSLVLVDLIGFVQRVLAARMRSEMQASTSVPSRPLLFPVRIECADEAAAQRLGADLQALGLTLNPLGPKTLALRALPRVVPDVDAERLGRALAAGSGVGTSDDLAVALAAAVTIPGLANDRAAWWQRWLAQASEAGIAPEPFIRRLDAAALDQLTGRRDG